MRNITVAIDDGTYRAARIRAIELDTSVSALVRNYLRSLVNKPLVEINSEESVAESRARNLVKVIEDIQKSSPDFSVSENLSRDALYGEERVDPGTGRSDDAGNNSDRDR